MDSHTVLIFLISADTHLGDELAKMLRVSVSTIAITFDLKTAVSIPQVVEKEITPDVVVLYVDGESEITAISDHFPGTPIILITDEEGKQDDLWMRQPMVVDVVPRVQLTGSVLQRLLVYAYQTGQHTMLKNKAQEHRRIAAALLQTGVQLNAIFDYDLLLDEILKQAASFFSYDVAAIMMREQDLVFIERVWTKSEDDGALQWVIEKASNINFSLQETRNLRKIVENGRYLVIPSTDNYPGWLHKSDGFQIRSWMGAPLIVQDEIIGFLSLDKAESGFYQDEQGKLLATFAQQSALALRNALIYQERQREIAELSALYAVSQVSAEAVTVDDLLTRCTQIAVEKLYPDCFGFILINDDNESMRIHHAVHERLPGIYPEKLTIGTGVVGQVIETGQLRRIADVSSEPEYARFAAHTHSELCVPLKVGEKIIGAINTESILFDAFTEADERFMVALSQQVTSGIERIQLLEAERRNRDEADKLREATSFLTTSLDLVQVFNNILRGLDEVVPYASASVILLNEDKLEISATRGFYEGNNLVGQTFPASEPFFSKIRQTKRPLNLDKIQQNPHFKNWGNDDNLQSWLCLPLIIRDKVLGILTIDNQKSIPYGSVEVQLAQTFANQAAIAIDNSQLYNAEQQARKRAEILREASDTMVKTLDQDTILSTLLEYLHKLVPFDTASVLFVEGDFAQIHLSQGLEEWADVQAIKQVRINIKTNGTFQEIIRTRQGLLIPDVYQDDRWEIFEASSFVRSWIGVPIIAGGDILGCFSIDKTIPGYFNEKHLDLVEGFTSQAAVILQNARLLKEMQQRAVELELITTLSAALRETSELETMFQIVLEHVLPLVNGAYGGIYLLEPETGYLIVRCTLPKIPELIGQRQSIDDGISGYVARTGAVYVSPDIASDPLLKLLPGEEPLSQTIRTGVNLPLWAEKRVVGVLHVNLEHQHMFSDMEIQLLTAVSEIAGTAIDRVNVLDTLEQRVFLRTRELAQANNRLTELDQLKTKFVSDVSHELRTPITNLSLYLDLLERGRPERREKYTAVLRRQTTRLTAMLEDILNISRLDMGKIKLNIAQLNINEIVRRTLVTFENQIDENIALITESHDDIPLFFGDEKQITQILVNLLNNAIAYTQDGEIRIVVSSGNVQNHICIQVKDTGMGIPSQELTHVFDRFYRASNVSQSSMPGTGLGLSLVKELVDLHHGDIGIISEPNVGTTVTIHLPIAPRLSPVA